MDAGAVVHLVVIYPVDLEKPGAAVAPGFTTVDFIGIPIVDIIPVMPWETVVLVVNPAIMIEVAASFFEYRLEKIPIFLQDLADILCRRQGWAETGFFNLTMVGGIAVHAAILGDGAEHGFYPVAGFPDTNPVQSFVFAREVILDFPWLDISDDVKLMPLGLN